jgi:hypothetical protein
MRGQELSILILSLPRRMENREDNDFVVCSIEPVVDEVRIPSGDEFAHILHRLSSADFWKHHEIL